jgi:hypothetical protein
MEAPARRRRTAPLLVVLATAWAACEGPGASVEPASRRPTATAVTTVADEITLTGRVTAFLGLHLFAVGSGAERVVVVTATPVAASVGSHVDVTGRVRIFRRQELEAELGVDLGQGANELEETSCLVASVARLR